MQTFWNLFKQSVIVQASITLMLFATTCYLFVTGQEVPELLGQSLMLVLGFYFGSKVQQIISQGGK